MTHQFRDLANDKKNSNTFNGDLRKHIMALRLAARNPPTSDEKKKEVTRELKRIEKRLP